MDNPGASQTSKLRKTMLGRRVDRNADGCKVGNFGKFGISYHGEEKANLEVDTARVAPVSAKPPPPKPPSTLSSDKVAEKDRKRKGARRERGFRRKRRRMRLQRRKDTGDSRRWGSRCCGKSLFFDDSESRKLGASESTTGALVSTVAECE